MLGLVGLGGCVPETRYADEKQTVNEPLAIEWDMGDSGIEFVEAFEAGSLYAEMVEDEGKGTQLNYHFGDSRRGFWVRLKAPSWAMGEYFLEKNGQMIRQGTAVFFEHESGRKRLDISRWNQRNSGMMFVRVDTGWPKEGGVELVLKDHDEDKEVRVAVPEELLIRESFEVSGEKTKHQFSNGTVMNVRANVGQWGMVEVDMDFSDTSGWEDQWMTVGTAVTKTDTLGETNMEVGSVVTSDRQFYGLLLPSPAEFAKKFELKGWVGVQLKTNRQVFRVEGIKQVELRNGKIGLDFGGAQMKWLQGGEGVFPFALPNGIVELEGGRIATFGVSDTSFSAVGWNEGLFKKYSITFSQESSLSGGMVENGRINIDRHLAEVMPNEIRFEVSNSKEYDWEEEFAVVIEVEE